jgi:prolyl-tRNA synthetase
LRFSEAFIPTLREAPAEAEVPSHALMLRAGLIKKVAAGIYTFLPLGLRILRKVESIVREEMNRAGAQEILMSALQPAELWKKSGRWEAYGPEMMRLKDRNDREFCLGPTHEELITEIVQAEVRSYRQLPLNLYQIQAKFRDEIRPRFGVMRGREFIMKDAYSFDADYAGLEKSYKSMYQAYRRIFDRMGLNYYVVEATTGLIGGRVSQEFMVAAKTGEDTLFYCTECSYAANADLAQGLFSLVTDEELKPLQEVATPSQSSVEEVSKFLNVPPFKLVKTLIYQADGKLIAVLIPGHRRANIIQIARHLNSNDLELLTEEEFQEHHLVPGFVGPVNLSGVDLILADEHIKEMRNFVVGANKPDTHFTQVNLERDFEVSEFGQFVLAEDGDNCPRCESGVLKEARGIEVGHIFQLGTKYSEAMGAYFNDENGKLKPFVMGCYGIGISRLPAAIIEQSHDERGIIWPASVAPFDVHLVLVMPENESQRRTADALEKSFSGAGLEVLYDERPVSPGVKFADADLIGVPYQIIVGKKVEKGLVELKVRKTGKRFDIKPREVVGKTSSLLKEELESLNLRHSRD